MPGMREKGFFEKQVDRLFRTAHEKALIADALVKEGKKNNNKIINQLSNEHAAYLKSAKELDISPEHIAEMANPKLKLNQLRCLFKINKYFLERALFRNIKDIDIAEKLIDKIVEDRRKVENEFGIDYAKKVTELPYHLRDMYADVPESVKFHFIDILSQSSKIKISDLDPKMTAEQANVIATVAPLYLKRARTEYSPKEVLTGNIFRDKDGKLPSAEEILEMANKDFRGLAMVKSEYDGQEHINPRFNWKDYKKEIKNLEALSFEITGKANPMLEKLAFETNDMAFHFNLTKIIVPKIENKYFKQKSAEKDTFEDKMDKFLEGSDLTDFTAKDIKDVAKAFKDNNLDVNFSNEYIEDYIRAVHIDRVDFDFNESTQKAYRIEHPIENFDTEHMSKNAVMFFSFVKFKDGLSEEERDSFTNKSYDYNGNKVEFGKDGKDAIEITDKEGNVHTFEAKDYLEADKETKKNILNDIAFLSIHGRTQEQAVENADNERKLDEEYKKQEEYNKKKELHKRDSLENKTNLTNEIKQLEDDIKAKTGMQNVVVVLKKNEIQLRNVYEGKDKSLKLNFRDKDAKIKDNDFFKGETFADDTKRKDDLKTVEDLFKDFTQNKVTPEVLDQKLEQAASKEVAFYLKDNKAQQFDIETIKKSNSDIEKQFNNLIPNAVGAYVFENGKIGISTFNKGKTHEQNRFGLILFDKQGKFEIKGADKNLNNLKTNQKDQKQAINDIKKLLVTSLQKEFDKQKDNRQDKDRSDNAL